MRRPPGPSLHESCKGEQQKSRSSIWPTVKKDAGRVEAVVSTITPDDEDEEGGAFVAVASCGACRRGGDGKEAVGGYPNREPSFLPPPPAMVMVVVVVYGDGTQKYGTPEGEEEAEAGEGRTIVFEAVRRSARTWAEGETSVAAWTVGDPLPPVEVRMPLLLSSSFSYASSSALGCGLGRPIVAVPAELSRKLSVRCAGELELPLLLVVPVRRVVKESSVAVVVAVVAANGEHKKVMVGE